MSLHMKTMTKSAAAHCSFAKLVGLDGSGYLPALAVFASCRVRTTWTLMTRGAHSGQHRYGNHRHGQNRCSKSIRTRSWLSAHTANMLHGECAGIAQQDCKFKDVSLSNVGISTARLLLFAAGHSCVQVLERQCRLLC